MLLRNAGLPPPRNRQASCKVSLGLTAKNKASARKIEHHCPYTFAPVGDDDWRMCVQSQQKHNTELALATSAKVD